MKKQIKRVLALIVAAALVLTMIISVMVTAHAEETRRDEYSLDIELIESEQALRVTQRLVFVNDTGARLDRAVFALYVNMFRRASTVMYETEKAMPAGFTPAGADMIAVTVDGISADWGVMDTGEYFIRVACDIQPGEACEFGFEYNVLLSENAAFCGYGENGFRLSGFYPLMCVYTDGIWEGNYPVQHSRYALTHAADYTVDIHLPAHYAIAAPGEKQIESDGIVSTWHIKATNIREFAFAASPAWHDYTDLTDEGTRICVYSADRIAGRKTLKNAINIVNVYENWFGKLPTGQIDIAQSDYCLNKIAFPGLIWLDSDTVGAEMPLSVALAEQYFGLGVYADPSADSWLCGSLCEYVGYLYVEKSHGYDKFIDMLRKNAFAALTITIPGDKYITADAAVFNQAQYDAIVRARGAVAMHEMRQAVGPESFIDALRTYFEKGKYTDIVTEMDLVDAFDTVTGGDWEAFMTDILFNIEDYSDVDPDRFD